MRVAPLGACFADDLALIIKQTTRSAIVTHRHSAGSPVRLRWLSQLP